MDDAGNGGHSTLSRDTKLRKRGQSRHKIVRAAWVALLLVTACASPEPERVEDASPRVYQIFFDWNSAGLTSEAETTITGVASLFGAGRSFPIMVVGYADLLEEISDLNRRRADAVQARLIDLGIASERITVAAAVVAVLGDAAAGPAEPQHRRVQIERR